MTEQATNRCRRCIGKGVEDDGRMCIECDGTGKKTFTKTSPYDNYKICERTHMGHRCYDCGDQESSESPNFLAFGVERCAFCLGYHVGQVDADNEWER
jgi:hypothetical protein